MQLEHGVLPRFIVGMPRAGTTWLCRSLNQRPDVAVLGETMFWGKSYVASPAGWLGSPRRLERMKSRLLDKPLETTVAIPGPGRTAVIRPDNLTQVLKTGFAQLPDTATPTDLFLNACTTFARAEGKAAWVEKTPHHVFHAQRILRRLPHARFVAMVREPYSFMLSYKHQPGYKRTPQSRRRFEDRYHPLACALVWRLTWQAIQRLLRARPLQTLVIRMEDIEADPQEVMRRVQEFFDLKSGGCTPVLSERINSSFDTDSRPELSEGDVAWMNIVAGREIEDAGYSRRSLAREADAVWRSALEIPSWSVRFLLDRRAATTSALRQSDG